MREHVIDISTEVFQLLREGAPQYVTWSEQKPGPTQRILVGDEAYTQLIDRAIEQRKTLDQVILEVCARSREHRRPVVEKWRRRASTEYPSA